MGNWLEELSFIHDNSLPFIYADITGMGEWYDLEHRGAQIQIKKQDGDNGALYLESIRIIIPGLDFSKTETTDLLSRGNFMFIGSTNHGMNQLLGTDRPLRMRDFEAVGSDSENLYRITFSGLNTRMAPFVLDDYVNAVEAAPFSSGFSPGFA